MSTRGSKAGKQAPETNGILFIRNLPYKLASEKLYDLFGKYGAIYQIRIGTIASTKGTAFVVYEDPFDAKTAYEHLNGYSFEGRYLIVLYYQPSRQTKKMDLAKRQEELKTFLKANNLESNSS